MNQTFAISGTEIRIGFRNLWVLMASIIMLVFALMLVFLGSAPSGATKIDSLKVVVASLTTLSVYLVPLIALLLSYDAIAGEIDRGTLQLTLASPVSRGQVIFGKFVGHVIVLATAVILGYGITAAFAYLSGPGAGVSGLIDFGRLILTSIILGATFIAIGYVASASVRQTGTAAALAIGLWLLTVVMYDLALLGGLLASADGLFASTIFPYLLAANPADAFRLFNMAAIDITGSVTGLGTDGANMPFSPSWAIFSPVIWTVLALSLATFILRRIQP